MLLRWPSDAVFLRCRLALRRYHSRPVVRAARPAGMGGKVSVSVASMAMNVLMPHFSMIYAAKSTVAWPLQSPAFAVSSLHSLACTA